MPRQPLMNLRPGAHYYINRDCMAERPMMSAMITQSLTLWSQIEVEMSLILAALLDTRSDAAVAVYLSLRNARAQRDALNSAAGVALSGQKLNLFKAVTNIHMSYSSQRNDLAHGIFGVVTEQMDELIWCPADRFAAWVTRANQTAWNLQFDPDPHAPLRKELFIYRRQDLEEILDGFRFVFDAVTRLHMMLNPISAGAEFGREWLLQQPLIQSQLDLQK